MPGFEWIDEEEKNAVASIFDEGGVLFAHGFDKIRKNYHVREFENKFCDLFGISRALAVTSGTAAIKIGLKSLGVNKGDEVITQAFNFVATIEAILDCGAKPIICNVNQTLNMDSSDLENKISDKTKAIIPVHMLGVSAEMDKILNISKKYKLPILEDNCEAIGARYNNKFLGTIGDLGILSFDQGKMIATGEGGMILTNNNEIDRYCRQYHDHGHENNPNFPRGKDTHKIYGFNYRMTEMQAAVGKVQLNKLSKMLIENENRAKKLNDILINKYEFRSIPKNSVPTWDTVIINVENFKHREKIIKILNSEGFGTKNLPDAMEWHCSYYWDHALDSAQISNSLSTKKILEKSIAIPIWLRKTVNDYEKLGKKLLEL